MSDSVTVSSSSSSSSLSLGGLIWFVLLPFILGYMVSGESISNGFFLMLWVWVISIIFIVPIIGFPVFFFVIHPFTLALFIPTGMGTVFALYFLIYFIAAIFYHACLIFIIFLVINEN